MTDDRPRGAGHRRAGAAPFRRAAPRGRLRRAFGRPELGALAGTLLVFLFFGTVAGIPACSRPGVLNWLECRQLGIIAIGACLLMIAGEFDLSLGSMIGFAGMVIASRSPSTACRCGRPFCWLSDLPWRSLSQRYHHHPHRPAILHRDAAFLFICAG